MDIRRRRDLLDLIHELIPDVVLVIRLEHAPNQSEILARARLPRSVHDGDGVIQAVRSSHVSPAAPGFKVPGVL